MKLSKRWLADYCKIGENISDRDFAEAMTMSGSKVETYETEGAELRNVVVGHVLTIERHPDSDHMFVCSIDAGGNTPVQIVTGAQNVHAGDYVPTALDDSTVHGKEIHTGILRGVESAGMLCSLSELGLTVHDYPYAEEDGIFILGDDCNKTVGLDIREALGFNDKVVDFEITSNRPDCLSVLGLAREASATFGVPFNPPVVTEKNEGDAINQLLKVSILDNKLCYRYTAAVVKNIRVAPSPLWLRERLRASGVRPINNIVDITNFVMLEYGHPMHAFDLKYINNGEIKVRRATEGEAITTLDGVERTLSPEMLVIADSDKPVAVAGVMGGEFSGIMDDTETIVFESACFNGTSVRLTAKKLGMRTESSGRFEKELDPNTCMPALLRALSLIRELDAGDIVPGIIDCGEYNSQKRSVKLDPDWINGFLGTDISREDMVSYLKRLYFEIDGDTIYVPTYRSDVSHHADIAEEIARMYGYNKIPSTPLPGVAEGRFTDMQNYLRSINDIMLGAGFTEIYTYSFVSPKLYDKLRLSADSPLRKSVVIMNPLGEDTSIMRTTAIPSMLDILSRNYNNRNASAYLYEIATEYTPIDGQKLPDEREKAVIGLYGANVDYFTLKGAVEELLDDLSITGYDVTPVTDNPTFHPGRTAIISLGGKQLGIMGEIHPKVCDNFEIGVRAYVASLDIETMFGFTDFAHIYKPLPKFPAATRDLALLCDDAMPVLKIEKLISGVLGKLLEEIKLFDVYRGKQIGDGKKSVAFSLILRKADGTLTDTEADQAVESVLATLSENGITLRK